MSLCPHKISPININLPCKSPSKFPLQLCRSKIVFIVKEMLPVSYNRLNSYGILQIIHCKIYPCQTIPSQCNNTCYALWTILHSSYWCVCEGVCEHVSTTVVSVESVSTIRLQYIPTKLKYFMVTLHYHKTIYLIPPPEVLLQPQSLKARTQTGQAHPTLSWMISWVDSALRRRWLTY